VVGYKKVFMPATAKVLELSEPDELRSILCSYPMAVPSGDEGNDAVQQHASALWLQNGCHPLSFLVRVAGPVSSLVVHRGRDSSGVLVLRHRSGALSNLHLALGAPYSQPFERYTVHGKDTTITVENSRRVTYQRGTPMDARTESFAPPGTGTGAIVWEAQDSMSTFENRAEVTQGLYGGLAHFFACILAGTRPDTADLTFARHLVALHEAAILSAGDIVEIGEQS
jgi:predicted dehydrogenase